MGKRALGLESLAAFLPAVLLGPGYGAGIFLLHAARAMEVIVLCAFGHNEDTRPQLRMASEHLSEDGYGPPAGTGHQHGHDLQAEDLAKESGQRLHRGDCLAIDRRR